MSQIKMYMHYMSSGPSSKDDYSTSLFHSGFTRGATCFKILRNNLMFWPQLSKCYLGARHGERREKANNFPYLSARESRAFSSIRLIKLSYIVAISGLRNQLYQFLNTYIYTLSTFPKGAFLKTRQ